MVFFNPQMTAWNLSTATNDPTSHSSPTPPVGQPNMQISNIPSVPRSFPLSIRLHSQKAPACSASSSPSIVCTSPPSDVSVCEPLLLLFYRMEEVRDKNKDKRACSWWPLKTDHGDNTTLHFLVVMLYTEQASVLHNERGNVAMHKLGYSHSSMVFFSFFKGLFISNKTSTISNRF